MTREERTLVVLGASADQLFLIRTAQELGLSVLAIDRNPSSPGFGLAEEHAVISTRDVPAVCAFLERSPLRARLAGVLTMGSDIPDAVSAVAERLGLPHLAPESARLATDKLAMKERFAERGVPSPWFTEVRSAAELARVFRERGPRLVLKPVDRSGSRGVFLLDGSCDLAELYERSRAFSYTGRVMAEEYLAGPQLSTETVMIRGRGITPGFADRNYELLDRFRPQVMENGAWVPSRCTAEERTAVEALVERAALALGLTDGIAKGDVVLTEDGPRVIEIAARLSGGDFCESLVPLSSGVNYVGAAIQLAIGEEPDLSALEPRFGRAVANRYFFPEPGRVLRIEGADEVRARDWVHKLEFAYAPGDELPPLASHAQRCGVFVVSAGDRDQLERRIEWVYRTLRITTAPALGTLSPSTARRSPRAPAR